MKPKGNLAFDIYDTSGIKLLCRLRLNFSHLNKHKFWCNFNDTEDPICTCTLEPETILHYLLGCNLYSTKSAP